MSARHLDIAEEELTRRRALWTAREIEQQPRAWRRTQELLHEQIGTFPAEDIRKITWENASRLFEFPVPDAVQHDPEAY